MSNNDKRIESANQKLRGSGITFTNNEGILIIERPGDPSSTAHDKVQTDLGPVSGTYASWCLDATLGVSETATTPSDEQKMKILKDTGYPYPEKVKTDAAVESKK